MTIGGLMYPERNKLAGDGEFFPLWANYNVVLRDSNAAAVFTQECLMLQLLNAASGTLFVEINGEIAEIDKQGIEDIEVEVLSTTRH